MKKKTKMMWVVAAIAALITVMAVLYLNFAPKTHKGVKAVTIEVVDDKGKTKEYQVHTDAEYLLGAMEDAKIEYEGEEGEYGLSIHTINGVKADYNSGATYWAFYVNGEYANYGPSEQPVADEDKIKIEYAEWKE